MLTNFSNRIWKSFICSYITFILLLVSTSLLTTHTFKESLCFLLRCITFPTRKHWIQPLHFLLLIMFMLIYTRQLFTYTCCSKPIGATAMAVTLVFWTRRMTACSCHSTAFSRMQDSTRNAWVSILKHQGERAI